MNAPYRWAGLAAALVLSAVSVNASATCWNNGCWLKDPVATGCNVGSFVAASAAIKNSAGSVVGHVQLRYSPACGAAWGYVGSAIGAVSIVDAEVMNPNATLLPAGECDNCSSVHSRMTGDAGTEKAKAIGSMRVHIIWSIYQTYTASTAWF